jgi:biotin synthase
VAGVRHVETTSIHRFSIVTSGGRLPSDEIRELAGTLSEHSSPRPKLCVSLGLLEEKDFALLKRADVSRYHHNLETARSHFSSICSTHTYEERITVIRRAKAQGLSICCGGIFGIGESDDQILEFACELRNLEADAIPINFLTPIKGTPLEKAAFLNPLKCLKIIALFRFVLPDREIIICGGRENNLRELHPLIFFAGASGIMTGHYLTTEGRQLGNDLELLADLNFYPR